MSHHHYISQGQRQRRKYEDPDFGRKSADVGKTRSESMPARDDKLDNSNKRRHRIFQDSQGLFSNDQTESQKRNRSCIFPKKTPDKNQVKKDSFIAANIQPQVPNPAKVQPVAQQLVPDSNVQISIQAKRLSLQLRKKEQEVQYLKLEIERYRRCDKLSRQNESLYKKISQKLQDTPQKNKKIDISATASDRNSGGKNILINRENKSPANIIENIKEKIRQNQKEQTSNADSSQKPERVNLKDKDVTPIQSLQDIKFPSERSSQKRKFKQTGKQTVILKNAFNVDPIPEAPQMYKTSPQPNVSHSPKQHSQTLTFNHRSHSKRKQEDLDIQSNLQKIQDKFYSTRRLGRTTMGDIPINRRLQQMNRLLEGNSRYKTSSQHGAASKTRPQPRSPNHR